MGALLVLPEDLNAGEMSLLLINPGNRASQLKFRFPVLTSVSAAWGVMW